MEAMGGDRLALEQALGLPDGYFHTDGVVRVDVPEPNNFDLRIPSGNEAGANDQRMPGGFLPTGMPEAVIDGADVPPDDLTITDLMEGDSSEIRERLRIKRRPLLAGRRN